MRINDESALHRELYGRRPHSSEAAGSSGQLAQLADSIFVSVFSPSTLKTRPKITVCSPTIISESRCPKQ